MLQSRELLFVCADLDSFGVAACPSGGVTNVCSPELIISSALLLGLFQLMQRAVTVRNAIKSNDDIISILSLMVHLPFYELILAIRVSMQFIS